MQRNLSEFNGDGLIVGGGWCEKHPSLKPSIRNNNNFYTIDIDDKEEPDAVIDITNEIQCSIIPGKRFNLIYFECFPYSNEEYLLKAFNIARRILKEDGVLIYHGGSSKSDSSIPEILKNAGFLNAIKKELDPVSPKADRDNGSTSLASDTDLKIFQENFSTLPETMRFYLTWYQFFSKEPYSIYPQEIFSFSSQPNNLRISIPTLNNNKCLKNEEWSTKIDSINDPFHLFNSFDLHNSNVLELRILTENEAHATIRAYSDGAFLVFQKDEAYHLLAKVNSKIHHFDILTKSDNSLDTLFFRQSIFNLKNEVGELIFNSKGVSASSLYSFLNTRELREQFLFQINPGDVKILGQKGDSLKTLSFKNLLIQDPSLSWLSSLPDKLQDEALFYFLNTFISNLYNISNAQSFINDILFNTRPGWKPIYPKNYSIEEIGKKLDCLRVLYQHGNTKAAMVLASIVYSGLGEQSDDDRMSFELVRRHHLFSQPNHRKEKEPLFRDLEEYREITQNPACFPDKVVRDLFLWKFFEEKNNNEMVNTQLKEIDLNQAIWLSTSFCDDRTIFSCIKLEMNSLQQLISNKQVFHCLINLGRIWLANQIKFNFPEEVLKEKDKNGRNILHTLIDYLSINKLCGSGIILDIFKFICRRFPGMLADPDNKGRTVYDDIERLKSLLNAEWDKNIYDEIELIIEKCEVGEIKISLGNSESNDNKKSIYQRVSI